MVACKAGLVFPGIGPEGPYPPSWFVGRGAQNTWACFVSPGRQAGVLVEDDEDPHGSRLAPAGGNPIGCVLVVGKLKERACGELAPFVHERVERACNGIGKDDHVGKGFRVAQNGAGIGLCVKVQGFVGLDGLSDALHLEVGGEDEAEQKGDAQYGENLSHVSVFLFFGLSGPIFGREGSQEHALP